MRARSAVAFATAAAVLSVVAGSASSPEATAFPARSSVDVYIFGKVLERVPGRNRARVEVRWAFKCLGDKLGEATYEWTLVASTLGEDPARKVTLRSGTTKTGSLTTALAPGRWQLRAEPFLCETERGAGSTAPEVGQVVDVANYCAWRLTKARGAVEVEAGSAVRRGRPGMSIAPPAAVATPALGSASLETAARELAVTAGRSTELEVRRGACTAAGPSVTLQAGSLQAVARGAVPSEVRAEHARMTALRSSWSVVSAPGHVTVSVSKGSVAVRGASGGPVVVRAGFRTTVAGRSGPTVPVRA